MVDDRTDTKINRYYEKLLLVRYGGKDGIFSMLSGYLYQSTITYNKYPILSMVFEGMALSKFRHMKMLERLISNFGNDDKIFFGVSKKITIEKEDYDINIVDILNRDIELEKQSINENQRLVEIIKEPVATAVLRDIISDEKKHLKKIRRIVSGLEFF